MIMIIYCLNSLFIQRLIAVPMLKGPVYSFLISQGRRNGFISFLKALTFSPGFRTTKTVTLRALSLPILSDSRGTFLGIFQ